jgi:alpha-glucosidase
MVLNLGMSGISYTGPDTGGFTGSPSPELFTRWMQLSAFLPFFRTHSMLGSPDQEPWAFGDQTEQICRTVLEWRYRLLPYLYTAAWQSSSSGTPMIRSMAFMFPELNSFYRIDDQFFCGDHLLVAPILREGATERTVTLPEGIWYDYWTGEAHEGGKVIQVSASLDQIPVFARAGAAIPLWPVQQHVGEDPIDELTLRCFAGSTGSVLFEDDGMTPTTSGRYSHRLSHIALDLSTQKGIFRLNRVLNEGIYVPSYSSTNLEIFGLKAEPASVQEDSLEVKRADSTDGSVRLSLDSNGPFEVTIRF